jgi:hypothetical protein
LGLRICSLGICYHDFRSVFCGLNHRQTEACVFFSNLALCIFWGGLCTTFIISGLMSLVSYLLNSPKQNDLGGGFFFGTLLFGAPLTLGVLPFVAWLLQAAQKFRWSLFVTGFDWWRGQPSHNSFVDGRVRGRSCTLFFDPRRDLRRPLRLYFCWRDAPLPVSKIDSTHSLRRAILGGL